MCVVLYALNCCIVYFDVVVLLPIGALNRLKSTSNYRTVRLVYVRHVIILLVCGYSVTRARKLYGYHCMRYSMLHSVYCIYS